MKSSKISRGFTLIELLVVIAIIAILAAILFPVFAQARRQAYKAVGTSNVKQAALSILMYAQDFDEKMPRAGWGCRGFASDAALFSPGDENSCGATEWQNVTQAYIKNIGIFKNPGDGSVGSGPKGWGGTDLNASDGNFSMLINDLLSHTMATENGYANALQQTVKADGLSLAGINAPSDCALLLEGHCGWNKLNGSSSNQAWDTVLASGKSCRQDPESKLCKEQTLSGFQTQLLTSNTYSGAGNVTGLPFYAGGGVVAFSDGHAKFIRYSDSAGNPTLCSSLPWTKSVDPQQRGADNTAAYCDPAGPNPPGGSNPRNSNWN